MGDLAGSVYSWDDNRNEIEEAEVCNKVSDRSGMITSAIQMTA